jgi:hypothetical protein
MIETKETKIARKGVPTALGVISNALAAYLIAATAFYTSAISSLNSQVTNLKNQLATLQKQLNDVPNTTAYYQYHDEFGNVSLLSPNLNFSPPVSMYRALTIALESDGWNTASLSNKEVSVSLEYWKFSSNPSSNGSEWLHSVTQPAEDYSPVQINGTAYRYIWDISVEPKVGKCIPPLGLYWVDAATGEILSHGLVL